MKSSFDQFDQFGCDRDQDPIRSQPWLERRRPADSGWIWLAALAVSIAVLLCT